MNKKKSVANKESQRCNGKNTQSDSRHKDFESRLLDLPIRTQPALEDEGQWKEKNEASFSRTMKTVLHLEPGYTCENTCECVYAKIVFFLLNINYICWFQKGNTPNWSCLFFLNCVTKYLTKCCDILQMISENCYFGTHHFKGQTRIISVWKVPMRQFFHQSCNVLLI